MVGMSKVFTLHGQNEFTTRDITNYGHNLPSKYTLVPIYTRIVKTVGIGELVQNHVYT